MRVDIRKAGVACGTLVASAAIAFSTATGALAANTALVIGGISAGSMSDLLMKPLLDYKFADQKRVNVQWPAEAAPFQGDIKLGASIATGITNMTASINTQLAQLQAGEKVTVVGLSAGSLVVNEVLRNFAASSSAPDKSKLTFILVADSSRQKLIDQARYSSRDDYTYQPPPNVKYDVIVVTGEYDGLADRPDRWWNFTALMNSIVGSYLVHVPMMYTTNPQTLIDEAAANGGSKWVWTETNSLGGTTTHVLIPTAKLPLVQMFPSLAGREAELKAKIDAGYSRNDVDNTARKAIAAAAPEASTFSARVTESPEAEDVAVEAPKPEAPKKTRGENAVTTTVADDDDVTTDDVTTDEVVTDEEDGVKGDLDSDNGGVDDDADASQEEADAAAEAEADAAAAEAEAAAKEADNAKVKEDAATEAADTTADSDPEADAPKNDGADATE